MVVLDIITGTTFCYFKSLFVCLLGGVSSNAAIIKILPEHQPCSYYMHTLDVYVLMSKVLFENEVQSILERLGANNLCV